MLSGGRPPHSDAELVRRAAARPLMLISAGRSLEAAANRAFKARGGPRVEAWNLPDAPHAAALRIDPRGYARRVIPFLDRSLGVG